MRIDIFHPWAGLKVHGGDSPPLWSKHDLHKQVNKLNILILMCQSLVFNWLILIKTPLAQTGEKMNILILMSQSLYSILLYSSKSAQTGPH